ncbi:Fc.00g034730.m01.CDS01 [Cosmosporella sp. VM-42]
MELSLYHCVAILGALTLLKTVYKLCSFLALYLAPSKLSRYEHTTTGNPPWAFVTGSSDGIGRAFAFELASRGFDVVLHGRNPNKLASVKADLEAKYPARQVRSIIADASDSSKLSFTEIKAMLADIPLKILVNNVGSTMPRHEFGLVDSYTSEELHANISTNATFPLLLTGALMPLLVANQPSLILNIGSQADVGIPLFPSYGPAKSFFMTSTIELGLEADLAERDVEVLGLRVSQVTGTGTIVLPPSFMIPEAGTWVKAALARVGCRRSVILPYWPHAVQLAILDALPDWMRRKALISAAKGLLEGDPTGKKAAAAAAKDLKEKAL